MFSIPATNAKTDVEDKNMVSSASRSSFTDDNRERSISAGLQVKV